MRYHSKWGYMTECDTCYGAGEYETRYQPVEGMAYMDAPVVCVECKGSGRIRMPGVICVSDRFVGTLGVWRLHSLHILGRCVYTWQTGAGSRPCWIFGQQVKGTRHYDRKGGKLP